MIPVRPCWTASTSLGGEASDVNKIIHYHLAIHCVALNNTRKPPRMIIAESDDGLLFSTVQVYSPPGVIVRVCVCIVQSLGHLTQSQFLQ